MVADSGMRRSSRPRIAKNPTRHNRYAKVQLNCKKVKLLPFELDFKLDGRTFLFSFGFHATL